MRVWPDFKIPDGFGWGVDEVFAGEYDIPWLTFAKLGREPIVLDCGANCGSFSRWMGDRLPDARVIAYEPHPKNAALFRRNCPEVELHEVAIVGERDQRKVVTLFDGVDGTVDGSGQASLECRGGQRAHSSFDVTSLSAAKLPPCDWLKIDTEGAEKEILFGYKHIKGVGAVCLEFHRRADLFVLGAWLCERGFICTDLKVDKPRERFGRHWGVMKFMRPEYMTECPECHREEGRRQGFYRGKDGMFECIECGDVFNAAAVRGS
jgi:FkbM family methyltransferase